MQSVSIHQFHKHLPSNCSVPGRCCWVLGARCWVLSDRCCGRCALSSFSEGSGAACRTQAGSMCSWFVQHSVMAIVVEFYRYSEAQRRDILRSMLVCRIMLCLVTQLCCSLQPQALPLFIGVSRQEFWRGLPLLIWFWGCQSCWLTVIWVGSAEKNKLIREMREVLQYMWQLLRLLKRKFKKCKWYFLTSSHFLTYTRTSHKTAWPSPCVSESALLTYS